MRFRRCARAVLAAVLVTVPLACDSGSPGPQPSGPPSASAVPTSGGLGGTLRVVGGSQPGDLDSANAASTQAAFLLRMTTRQLYSWSALTDSSELPVATPTGATATGTPSAAASADRSASATPTRSGSGSPSPSAGGSSGGTVSRAVPDIAAGPPQISPDGLTYTITLRSGVRWNVPAGRQVTATDAVRGIKRLCNPVAPSPLLGYFTSTIVGLQRFCTGFARVAHVPAAIENYVENTPVAGLRAQNDSTVTIRLLHRARDFTALLALPAASPVPTEMLQFLPGSAAYSENLVSDGPYRVTLYLPGSTILLRRNTQWVPSADPLRTAYVDGVQVSLGHSVDDQQHEVATGQVDLALDPLPPGIVPAGTTVTPSATASAGPSSSSIGPMTVAFEDRGTTAAVVMNLDPATGGDAAGALSRLAVRQALQSCLDTASIVRALGGPALASASHQILVPGVWGYRPQDIYDAASPLAPDRCKLALAGAHVPNLALTYAAVSRGREPAVVAAITQGLARAGITLHVVDVGAEESALNSPSLHWDIALTVTTPDWPGDSARSLIAPRFGRTHEAGGPLGAGWLNVGNFDAPSVDAGVIAAAGASSDSAEAAAWANLDDAVMMLSPAIPVAHLREAVPHASRLGGWRYLSVIDNADPTQIFLPPTVPATSGSPAGTGAASS